MIGGTSGSEGPSGMLHIATAIQHHKTYTSTDGMVLIGLIGALLILWKKRGQ